MVGWWVVVVVVVMVASFCARRVFAAARWQPATTQARRATVNRVGRLLVFMCRAHSIWIRKGGECPFSSCIGLGGRGGGGGIVQGLRRHEGELHKTSSGGATAAVVAGQSQS